MTVSSQGHANSPPPAPDDTVALDEQTGEREGWTSKRGRVAALSRSRSADDPDLLEARRELREARLADFITRTVAAAPPLTPAQRDRLALLLRGGPRAS